MGRTITRATLVSGTLDIAFAMLLTLLLGRHIPDMLRYVASGPYPPAIDMGTAGAVLGLLVHFALMAIMAAIFVWVVSKRRVLLDTPITTGMLYGLATYVAMNWIVVPLRFGTLPVKPLSIATQLFAHVVLVGIVFARIAAREMRSRIRS